MVAQADDVREAEPRGEDRAGHEHRPSTRALAPTGRPPAHQTDASSRPYNEAEDQGRVSRQTNDRSRENSDPNTEPVLAFEL